MKELIHEKARGRHLRTLRDEEDEKVLEDVQEAFDGGSAGEQLRTTRASDRTFPITKGGSGGGLGGGGGGGGVGVGEGRPRGGRGGRGGRRGDKPIGQVIVRELDDGDWKVYRLKHKDLRRRRSR